VARTKAHPGRTLGYFALGIVILFGLVALTGNWKPALGLDLQGGQRITLRAQDDNVSHSKLEEASKIINERVNGSGVAEAEVSTQGNTNVVVEIPGSSNQKLVETVQRQAQLRFRLLACSSVDPGPCASGSSAENPVPALGRAAPAGLSNEDAATESPSPTPTATQTPSSTGTPSPSVSGSPSGAPEVESGDVKAALAWRTAPPANWVKAFNDATCPLVAERTDDFDNPDKPLVTCDDENIKYLLSSAVVEGTELKSADAAQDQNSLAWQVGLKFKDKGAELFGEVSAALAPKGGELHGEQFAIVLDGHVISSPTMDAILSKEASISGGQMKESDAKSLATSLKYGALPVAFEDNPKNDTIGPSLAGNQLSAGIWAGIIGLLLVMVYCFFYYRGLGMVVIASLIVAGVVTYGMVLLLSKSGFTLSLPGIAGLIVAVGITADSFIVFFERIRDEMRDGKSMRVAVEAGWARARNTCLAADAVSLSAAVVLYIFAIDDVRGFAFTLGLCTLVDLVVFFWFTKPMVSWLGTHRFFNQGHRLSGLSAETLGVDQLAGVRAGGAA
jgi:preprotein translocase subunit SecD